MSKPSSLMPGRVASGRSQAGQPGRSYVGAGGAIGDPASLSSRRISAGLDGHPDDSVLHLYRVGRGRMGGRPGEDLAAADVEDGTVPRTPKRTVADQLSLAQGATSVGTAAIEREDLPAYMHQREPVAVNVDRPHRPGREV